MKKLLAIFLLIGSTVLARELTLDEAIDLSIENSKDIQISEKDLEISKLNVKKAFKTALPSVAYSGQYSRTNYNRPVTVSEEEGARYTRGGYTQNLTLTQPLFAGGAIIAGIKGAQAYENIASYNFLNSKIQIRIKTIEKFFNLLNAEKDLKALKNSKSILQKRYDKQKVQLDLRLIRKSDLSQTEYSLLEVESQIIALTSQIDTYREQLRIQTGLDRTELIEVKDFDIPMNLSENINIDRDLKQALTESLGARIVEEQTKISEAQRIAATGDMLPKVNAFVSYGTTNKNSGSNGSRTTFRKSYQESEWTGGIQVSWNIFSFGSDYDSYRIAKLEEEQQKLRETSTKENIEINVKSAYYDVLRLEKLRDSRGKALEVAKLNFEMDQERYEAGLISTIDYLDTEDAYRNASIAYNEALMNYYVAFERYRSLLI
ncbi:MAG: TolC family protein [Fusobacterium sp.]|nr:TolC family protein [Fusobacterium sp.]